MKENYELVTEELLKARFPYMFNKKNIGFELIHGRFSNWPLCR